MKIVDRILKIKTPKLPPENAFMEKSIKEAGIDPIRWAVIEVEGDILTVSAAGYEL